MIGDAIPIRVSRRTIKRASLLPIRVSPKRKIRQSAVDKRISVTNSSRLKIKEKNKVGRRNKLNESSNIVSTFLKRSCVVKPVTPKSPRMNIPDICEKKPKTRNYFQTTQVNFKNDKVASKNIDLFDNGKNTIEKKNCKKILNKRKQSVRRSPRLSNSSLSSKEKGKNKVSVNDLKASKKPSCVQRQAVSLKTPQINTPKVCVVKRKTRNSIQASQVTLKNDKEPLKNIELFDNGRNNIEKKNCKKFLNEKKQSVRKSLRLSKSSLSAKEKGKNKKVIVNNLKSSKKSSLIQKQLSTSSSELVLTPYPKKGKHMIKLSEGKKAKLPIESGNEEISLHTPVLFAVTPAPGKITRSLRLSVNPKSGKMSKELNRSRLMNSDISLYTSSFYSLLETPHPEKHLEKRKSSRLFEPSPLKALNKELPLSTPVHLLTKNPNSTLKKSSKSEKSVDLSSSKNHKKQSRSKASNEDISTYSQEKKKRQVNQHKKTSGNLKKSLTNETENFPLDVLTTPAFKPPCKRSISKKYSSKSDSKSSKRKLNASISEIHGASEELIDAKKRKSADFAKIPTKGTLKHKRWLLNNLTEKNGSYEDDIFENKNFDLYKQAFHLGDESDGSSVNIATPKFDCILTPALPQKTPRFKDCISPTEFLQARKTAEEYLFRRNKKRKSGNRPSSSGKKTTGDKVNAVQDIPEKKKLDFEEAVNKLIAVQKDLEIGADGDEEDSYFSDISN